MKRTNSFLKKSFFCLLLLFFINKSSFAYYPIPTSDVTFNLNVCQGYVDVRAIMRAVETCDDDIDWGRLLYWNGTSYVQIVQYGTGSINGINGAIILDLGNTTEGNLIYRNFRWYNIPQSVINQGLVQLKVDFYWDGCGIGDPEQQFSNTAVIPLTNIFSPNSVFATQNLCNKITISWQNPTVPCGNDSLFATEIYRGDSMIGTVLGTSASSFNDNSVSLSRGQDYNYRLRIRKWPTNNSFSLFSQYTFVTVGSLKDAPSSPTNVSASTDRCDGKIRITWSFTEATPTNFIIHRSTNSNMTNVTIYTLGGTRREFIDTNNIIRGNTYYYQIKAIDNCNSHSTLSDIVEGSSPGIPSSPLLTTILTDSINNIITINWNSTNYETGYEVQRLLSSGGVSTIFNVDQDITTFVDNTVASCNLYNYKVKALNACLSNGGVVSSNSKNAILNPNLSNIFNSTNYKLTCTKGYFPNFTQLEWNVSNENLLSRYRIFRKQLGSSSDSTLIADLPTGSNQYSDATSVAGVLYKYTIIGSTVCSGQTRFSNFSEDVGFRSPTGVINGKISYNGGFSVGDARVVAATTGTLAGSSLLLNGNNGYLQIPNSTNLMPTNEFTIETWVRPTNLNNSFSIIDKYNSSGVASGYRLIYDVNTSSLIFSVINSNGIQQVSVNNPFTVGSYKQVTAVYKSDSLFLYLNGVLGATAKNQGTSASMISNSLPIKIGSTQLAGNWFNGNIDELRVWNYAKNKTQVSKDFSRYVNPNETGLQAYYTFDENVPSLTSFFDASNQNNIYNKNDGQIIGGVTWSNNIPNTSQLGLAAYSDSNGNYSISNIRYSSSGQNFTVVPSFISSGVAHAFSPSNKVLFIGDGANIQNNVDFTDISSFAVTGNVRYLNTNCPVKEVSIKIDGNIVISGGTPVNTDNNGQFSVQVPIGFHVITVEKDGHIFSAGRFPDVGLYEFLSPVNNIQFVDSTFIKVVGRAVGGLTEGSKIAGLGRSKNNIGISRIIFRSQLLNGCRTDTVYTNKNTGEYTAYLPPLVYTVEPKVLSNLVLNFGVQPLLDLTNSFDQVKVKDSLFQNNVFKQIDSNFYNVRRDFIYRTPAQIQAFQIKLDNDTTSFLGDNEYKFSRNDKVIFTGNPFGYPIFSESKEYGIRFIVTEPYENNDSIIPGLGVYKTYYKDYVNGAMQIDNNFVLGVDTNSSINVLQGIGDYYFVGGGPNISADPINPNYSFTKTIDALFIPQGNVASVPWLPNSSDPISKSFRFITFGNRGRGNNFVTKGPSMVDFILRDPPGSLSFSTLAKGQSFSKVEDIQSVYQGSQSIGVSLFNGVKVSTPGGDVDAANTATLTANFTQTATKEGNRVTTTTFNTTVTTSADPGSVGSQADIFIGKSTNMVFGLTDNIRLIDTATCNLADVICIGNDFNGYKIGKTTGMFLVPQGIATSFYYTTDEIENIQIPNLITLRNSILANSKYSNNTKKYTILFNDASDPDYDKKYGSNNDDAIWGNAASTLTPSVRDSQDNFGQSYVFNFDQSLDPKYRMFQTDSVRMLNQQIALWKQALARNEREKYGVFSNLFPPDPNGTNISFGKATVAKDFSTEVDSTETVIAEFDFGVEANLEIYGKFRGQGAGLQLSAAYNYSSINSKSFTGVTSTTISYSLNDGDDDNLLSVDAVKSPLGNGHLFKLRAGQTSCPYEGETYAHYFNPSLPDSQINASTYFDDGESVKLAEGTAQIDVPKIAISPARKVNVPAENEATFILTLKNESEANVDNTYDLRLVEASNPYGAIVSIDGQSPNRSFDVPGAPGGSSITKTVSIKRGPIYYKYDSLLFIFKSQCDDNIMDSAYVSVAFLPTCTKANITNIDDKWVLNSSFKDSLPVVISNYDYNFGGFSNIELQYKQASKSVWNAVKTFYKDTSDITLAIPTDKAYTSFIWNVAEVADGPYDLRVASTCSAPGYDDVKLYSTPITGIIDRVNPHPFGTPSPADGILSPNDDISIQFNESIDPSTITFNNFDLRGVLNGSPVRNSTSLYFDGNSDNVEIESGLSLQKRSFTVEFWAKRKQLNSRTILFSQGNQAEQSISIGFDENNRMMFNMNASTILSNTSYTDTVNFVHYAVSYNYENQTVVLYVNGVVANSSSPNLYEVYEGSGKVFFGKLSYSSGFDFKGNLAEIRLWNTARSLTQVLSNMNKQLTGTEAGIVSNWRLDEANGAIAKDIVRSRNGFINNATWSLTPSGKSLAFNGVNGYLNYPASTAVISKEMDFTIEFWFKSNNNNGIQTLLSNGRGDNNEPSAEYKWWIGSNTSGNIVVKHNGNQFLATNSNYFDGNWHHFALVLKRSSSLTAFIDGNQQNSIPASSFGQFGGSKLWFGARNLNPIQTTDSTDLYFNGLIDEFRFWNVSRLQEQIKNGYQYRILGNESGLIAYIPFEDYTTVLGVPILSQSNKEFISNNNFVLVNGAGFSNETPLIKLPLPNQSIAFTYSINNDKIVLTPTTSQELIENVTLDITVKNILDKNGNIMQSPKTWIAYINKNQVKWQQQEFTFTKKAGASLTFNANIVNLGGALKQWNISNLPSWLTVSNSSGTVSPNSSIQVQFTVDPNVNIGNYEQALQLTTDFGFAELLYIKLKVSADAPASWSLNPSVFNYSMNIVAQLKVNNIILTNTESKLAAFVGNQCRGVANLQYLPQYDKYLAFITIYSNSNNTIEKLDFKIWNADAGKIHTDIDTSLYFTPDALIGNFAIPQVFNASDKLTRYVPLNAGWNWVSFNLLNGDSTKLNQLLGSLTLNNGSQLKNNMEFASFDIQNGWSGNLVGINAGIKPEKSYLLNIGNADTLVLKGIEVNPSLRPINLVPGWNWIGFPSQRNLTVNEAFGNYSATHGDVIKNQTQFAIYDSVMGWVGSLITMKPNVGFLYNTTVNGNFTYPRTAIFGKKGIDAENITSKYWQANAYAYPENTNIISTVNICNKLIENGNWLLGGFVNNELRGFAKAQLFNNQYAYFLTIAGNNNEPITFKLLDENSGKVYDLNENLAYKPNALLGSISNPFNLTATSLIPCKDNNTFDNDYYKFYPIPASNKLNVELNLNDVQSVQIYIYDIAGKLLYQTEEKQLNKGIQVIGCDITNIQNGIYIAEVMANNNVYRHKIIKN